MQLIKRETHEIIHVGNGGVGVGVGGGDRRDVDDRDYPVEMMMMRGHHHHLHLHETAYEKVRRLASGNAVVVFSLSECCMCHVVKRLLFGLGVGPTIIELDEQDEVEVEEEEEEDQKAVSSASSTSAGGKEMLVVLYQLISGSAFVVGGGGGPVQQQQLQQYQKMAVPAVFVGGKFLGGVQTVMSCHINGTLVPLLKNAGALWL